jgi:transcriptional regulator with GAF, ATPase, and Fis domain
MQMTRTFQDRLNLNLILTVLFILGIGASLYFIYSLPSALSLSHGYQPQFVSLYIVVLTTFGLGVFAVVNALRYRKEVVVFRDKIIDKAEVSREAAEHAGKTTISLDSIRAALNTSDLKTAVTEGLHTICKQLDAGQGALYLSKEEKGIRVAELYCGYALNMGESRILKFEFGEGLVGQVAATGHSLYVDDVPEGYITILSGLGNSSPRYLLLIPIKAQDRIAGVIEIASFTRATDDQRKFVEESAQLIGEKFV